MLACMEGGGQVLRVSVALAAITGMPIQVSRIRQGRSTPGLRAQHLAGIKLIRDISSGELSPCSVGSQDFVFTPGNLREEDGRVGARLERKEREQQQQQQQQQRQKEEARKKARRLLRTVERCRIHHPTITSCCSCSASVSCDREKNHSTPLRIRVYPILRLWIISSTSSCHSFATHFGADVSVSVAKRGYFPRGGGEVELSVVPSGLNPLRMLEQGEIVSVKAILRTFGYPASSQVLADMADLIEGRSFSDCAGSRDQNHKKNRVAVEVECNVHFSMQEEEPAQWRGGASVSGGSVGKKSTKRKGKSKRAGERKRRPFSVQLAATTTTGCILSANALGQRIGSERDLTMGAIHDLEALIASGSCVDEHPNQLIVFMALARGGTSALVYVKTEPACVAMYLQSCWRSHPTLRMV